MSDNKRAAKRFKRENRKEKETTWYCAGCKSRHPFTMPCPAPRLFASQNGRTGIAPSLPGFPGI